MRKMGLMIIFIAMVGNALYAGDRFFIRMDGGVQIPKGDLFKTVYGSTVPGAGIRVGARIIGPAGFWCGYQRMQANGESVEMREKIVLDENLFLVGVSACPRLGGKWEVFLNGAYARLQYREKGLGMNFSGKCDGWTGEVGVIVRLGKWLGLVVYGGYLDLQDRSEEEKIDFGGYRAGAGLKFYL